MTIILTSIHIFVCLFMVAIVLLQHGKGADIGATFGGSSETLLGTEGPVPLMNKVTTAVAVIFMLTSISLAYISANKGTGSVVKDAAPVAPPPIERPVESAPITVPLPAAVPAAKEGAPTAQFPQEGAGQSDKTPATTAPAK